jgi:hypothetical protein
MWWRSAAGGVFALVVGCSDDPPVVAEPGAPGGWGPGSVQPSLVTGPRGQLDLRGIVHAHSVYSHDACDDHPRDEATGAIDQVCFEDFRRDICHAAHDFIMLTDHGDSFRDTEFPETLLFRPDRGDVLVERDGAASANRAACPDGSATLIMAGLEAGTMPVGLERHAAPAGAERDAIYGEATPEAIAALKDAGAVSLVAHTEDWTADALSMLPLDGFEMYNLHANLLAGVGAALDLMFKLQQDPAQLPHPDLLLLPIVTEQPSYLDTWAATLASGARRVTTMGTDCHRNTFPQEMQDGERLDSYRRMLIWFSNHLLVEGAPDAWDDRALKDALSAGRLYGSFDMFGYPEGFDFHARSGGATHEMGAEVALAGGVELAVTLPRVQGLSAEVEPPLLTARILRAAADRWEVVAEESADLTLAASEPGAYRAEIRIVPRHLHYWLHGYADLASADFVWIYSNPIYLTE